MTPEERGEAISRRNGGEVQRLLRRAIPAVMRSQATTARKYIRLVEISRNVMDNIEPFTPCRRGCSHCCYMAVSIPRHEAEAIAQYTGRTLTTPEDSFPKAEETQQWIDRAGGDAGKAAALWAEQRYWSRYTGVPCTFLKDGECSIYNVRPLACRLHHVLEDDNSKCKIGTSQRTASCDLQEFDAAMADTFHTPTNWGDIREWFA